MSALSAGLPWFYRNSFSIKYLSRKSCKLIAMHYTVVEGSFSIGCTILSENFRKKLGDHVNLRLESGPPSCISGPWSQLTAFIQTPFCIYRLYTKNSKHIFPEKERRGHSPNSYIHVSVCDLYIPTIGLHFLLQENMWTHRKNIQIAHRHMNTERDWGHAVPFLGIQKSKFLCSVTVRLRFQDF